MRHWLPIVLVSLAVLGCATVVGSDRRQLRLIPRAELLTMSFQQYDEFLAENPESRGPSDARRIRDIRDFMPKALEYYGR